MSLNLDKMLKKILFIFLFVFIFGVNEVQAASSSAMVCIDGYSYYFESKDQSFDFTSLIGSSLKELGMSEGTLNGKSIYKGTSLDYSLTGYYYNSTSKLNNRCYTYTSSHDPSISTDVNGNTITTQKFDYTLKQCGNKYDIKLNFEDNSKLTDSLILDNATTEMITSYKELYGSNIIGSDGKISLVIRPDANSELLSVWDRIGVSVQYDGTTNYGKTGKGNCKVYGGNSKNIKDKYIECTNITPYQMVKDDKTGDILNKKIYKIYIYLNGIKTSDFNENVSNDVKQEYVTSCGGSNGSIYLGYITTNIINEGAIALTNPVSSNSTLKALCNQLNSIGANQKLIKAYVDECYSNKITYTQFQTLESTIRTKINKLKEIFGNLSVSNYKGLVTDANSADGLLCTDNRLGTPASGDKLTWPFESKIVYEDYSGYWGMVCIEDYYVDGGTPSLVQAGTGVEYSNQVQINKTCTITQLQTVQKKDQCVYYSNCNAYFDHGNDGIITSADTNGGPTDSFDSCVEECDGGKYTQSCINSCYRSNYSDERTSLLTNSPLTNYDFSKNYNIVPIAFDYYDAKDSVASLDPSFRGTINLGNGYQVVIESGTYQEDTDNNGVLDFNCTNPAICINLKVKDQNGNIIQESGSSVGCNANVEVLCSSYSGPPGCSDNPEAEYQSAINASKAELSRLVEIANTESQLEEYSISFTDSLTGYIYKITGTTDSSKEIDKPQLDIAKNDVLSSTQKKNVNYTLGSAGDSIKSLGSSVMTTVYDVRLPLAHVQKTDANKVVVENSNFNRYYEYQYDDRTTRDSNNYYIDTKDKLSYYKFNAVSSFNPALYTDGKKVYYTSLYSPDYNVLINSGKTEEELADIDHATLVIQDEKRIYELNNQTENIKVTLKVGHLGKNNFVSFDETSFDCYYGVYSFLDNPSSSPSASPSPTPTDGGFTTSGLRYYYREIYLIPDENGYGGIFPNNREPRWNWTGTIKNGEAIGAANNDDYSYVVDPERLIEDIESKGDAVFTDSSEWDYQFTMTPTIINQIREYNDSKINGRKITYLDFSLTGNTQDRINYSQKISEWYTGTNLYSTARNISECNNARNGKCDNGKAGW